MTNPAHLTALKNHMENSYADFDWQAMEICLAAVLCHYIRATEPVNLFVVGASGTGKTEVIRAFEDLPKFHDVSNLTTRALFSVKQGMSTMHDEVKENGILLFKDFTTVLSKRIEDQQEIFADLREIADGKYARRTGEAKFRPWKGKCTILAACTDEIENKWSLMQAMGNRFVMVRWREPDPRASGDAAQVQVNREANVRDETREIMRPLFDSVWKNARLASCTPEEKSYFTTLALMARRLRQGVYRPPYNHKAVEARMMEGTPRLAKAFSLIARAIASIRGRTVLAKSDIELARRLCRDSVPQWRMRIARAMADGSAMTRGEVASAVNIPPGSIPWRLEEMAAVGIVSAVEAEGGQAWYSLDAEFKKLLDQSKILAT